MAIKAQAATHGTTRKPLKADETAQLDPRETAAYIADMTKSLRLLAQRAGLNFLAYLLDMAATQSLDESGRR